MMDDKPHPTRHPYLLHGLRSRLHGVLRGLRALSCSLPKVTVLLTVGISLTISACEQRKVERQDLGIDIDSAYMMLTRDVDMLVSDSGITKYKLITPLWIIYDRPDRKQWYFPEGINMWSVDSVQPGNRLVTCDTAILHVDRDEWELIGNVRIHGLQGERLYTPHLYWQRRQQRLYSEDSTYFATEGRVLRGARFEAADNLSWYRIFQNSGEFEVSDNDATNPSTNSANAEASTSVPTPPHTAPTNTTL